MRARWPLLFIVLGLGLWVLPAASAPAAPAAVKRTFNIVVSTEWTPGADDQFRADRALAGCAPEGEATFLDDLRVGFKEFARYFYASTNGQMAIGNVTIHTGGVNWDTADIQILANGSYRPTAFIGGIVDAPTRFTGLPGGRETRFTPAPILLSRQWNGAGARCGPWSAPEGWRTLAHEWGHYALFLHDEYANQFSGRPQYCDTGSGLRLMTRGERAPATVGNTAQSLMAFHYTADQFSLYGSSIPDACRDTPQQAMNGESNWQTIARRYATNGVTAPDRLLPGPVDPPPVTISVDGPSSSGSTGASVQVESLPRPRLIGHSYSIESDSKSDAPLRIIAQGNIMPGSPRTTRFWGVQTATNARAAVVVLDPTNNEHWNYPRDYRTGFADAPTPLSTTAFNKLVAKPSTWKPRLRVIPIVLQNPGELVGRVIGLRAELEDCGDKQPVAVEFVYCPPGGNCTAPVPDTTPEGGIFSYSFFFDGNNAPEYGYIYAREPFRGAETMTWYQLGGGVGPAHVPGHAPLADGRLVVELGDVAQNDPRLPQEDARILYAPASTCTAQNALPPGVLGIVDTPLNVQVSIAGPNVSQPWSSSQPPLRVRLSYDQDLLDELQINETQLVILRLNQGIWQPVQTVGQSNALDWIAGVPVSFNDAGETFALGYGPALTRLPGVVR